MPTLRLATSVLGLPHEGEAKAVCAAAGKYLMAHNNGCPVCKRDKIAAQRAMNPRDLFYIPQDG
jgi:hypothetical protein